MQNETFKHWISIDKSPGDAHDEGIDDLTVREAARSIIENSSHSSQDVYLIEPKAARSLLRQGTEQATAKLQHMIKDFTGSRIVCIFAARDHWALLDCTAEGCMFEACYVDGMQDKVVDEVLFLAEAVRRAWNWEDMLFSRQHMCTQANGVQCGAFALLHLGWRLGMWQDFSEADVNAWYDALRWGPEELEIAGGIVGADAAVGWLANFLPAKGVQPDQARLRAELAIKTLGLENVVQAIQAKNPWQALKALGQSKPKPFMWVKYEELQQHIQDMAQQKHGADLSKSTRTQKKKEPSPLDSLDPAKLLVVDGSFSSADGHGVAQLAADEVCAGARGIAFMTVQQVEGLLKGAKSISIEPLAILTVGELHQDLHGLLPCANLRYPAIYAVTQEPVLIRGTLVQLGDVEIARTLKQASPEVTANPTTVVRIQVYRDQWPFPWDQFAAGPVKTLLQHCPLFRLCRGQKCGKDCPHFHASVEEQVDAVLLDLWSWSWLKRSIVKSKPIDAESFSVYARIPESATLPLQRLSGANGLYIEPRSADKPGPDHRFAVVWLQNATLQEVQLKCKQLEHAITVARYGNRYGVRCLAKHEELLHKTLLPDRGFFKCEVKSVYRLAPLPIGTQRTSLQETLKQWRWNAKPLQPSKGARGTAWEVGASCEPPELVFTAAHGDVTVTKIKEVGKQTEKVDLVASLKTRRSIQSDKENVQPASIADPWANGKDPWSRYQAPAVQHFRIDTPTASSAAQSKLDELEERLHTKLQESLETSRMEVDSDADVKLKQLEVDVAELKNQGARFESWFKDAGRVAQETSAKVLSLEQECQRQREELSTLQSAVKASTSELSQKVDGVADGLQRQFERHADRIEALFAKKQRQE